MRALQRRRDERPGGVPGHFEPPSSGGNLRQCSRVRLQLCPAALPESCGGYEKTAVSDLARATIVRDAVRLRP